MKKGDQSILSFVLTINTEFWIALKFSFCCFLYIVPGTPAEAQRSGFSQFFSSPLNLNPGYTGQITGDWRITGNIRSQGYYYSDPVNSTNLSIDKPINILESQFGVGLILGNDFSQNHTAPSQMIYGSLGKAIQISSRSGLGVGFQLGYVNKRLSYKRLAFPEQYDRNSGNFNHELPLSENFENERSGYLDINAGIVWNYTAPRYVISSGMAIFHLNQPKESFLNQEYQLKSRLNWHITTKYFINQKFYIVPQAYLTHQTKASLVLAGSNLGYRINSDKTKLKSLSIGAYYRSNLDLNVKTMVFESGFNFNNWLTTLSFDFNANRNSTGNLYSQAIEFSIIYERPSTILRKTTLPWIRY